MAKKKKVRKSTKKKKTVKRKKKKKGASKAQAVRDYLKTHKGASNKEVVAALAKKGIKISENYPSIVKSQSKSRKKKKRKKRKTTSKKVTRSKAAKGAKTGEWETWLKHNLDDFGKVAEIVKRAGEYNARKLVEAAISAKRAFQGEEE